MGTNTGLISGRVKKVPSANADPNRYNWLNLQNAEPDLGVPTSNGSIFTSDTTGNRSWSNALTVVSNTVTITNVDVSGDSNLGPLSNIIITGGSANYVISTDGLGNLSWVAQTGGNGVPGGSNTQVQYNSNGVFGGSSAFAFNDTTNTLTVTNFSTTGTSNLGPASNITITGGSANYVLTTDGAGNLSWAAQTGGTGSPGGFNTYVQFNDAGSFGGTGKFLFNKLGNTLTVSNVTVAGDGNLLSFTNTAGNSIKFAVPSTIANSTTFIVPNTSGTSQQVLGVTDQSTQQLGWKTLPTNYVSVELRDTTTYISSITPVLRVVPVRLRNGTFLELPAAQ